jgi:hypothetical protein
VLGALIGYTGLSLAAMLLVLPTIAVVIAARSSQPALPQEQPSP